MKWMYKLCLTVFLWSFAVTSAFSAGLSEKDLAIVLGTALKPPIRFEKEVGSEPLFPRAWYSAILEAYKQSSVGNTLAEENRSEDWQIVSLRVVPCLPMVRSLNADPATFCWPQLRIVWQPIVHRIRLWGMLFHDFGDDRAVHALYDIAAAHYLPAPQAARLIDFKKKINRRIALHSGRPPLIGPDMLEFVRLRNALIKSYLFDIKGLRDPDLSPDDYLEHGFRPELLILDGDKLRHRLTRFLGDVAKPSALNELTSFSLPEGREPALLNEWVFLAFRADERGGIELSPVSIYHARSGVAVGQLPAVHRASQRRDDPSLYEQENNTLRQQVFLYGGEVYDDLKDRILDPNQTMIANTSCSSCHRFNTPGFNFHNLSKFNNEPLEVSKRVVNDVTFDMEWLDRSGILIE